MDTTAGARLRDNLAVLPAALASAIEASAPEAPIDPEAAAFVETADARRVRLHSQRDPVLEAERIVASALPGERASLVVVVGPGLGYVLDVLERHAATTVVVLEPFAALAKAMLSRRDWRAWLTSGRLKLLVGPHYADSDSAWQLFDPAGAAPPTLVLPVLQREFPVEVARARHAAAGLLAGARANDEARRRLSGRYLLNTLRNIPSILGSGDVADLTGAATDTPAFVVAAGPSLDANLETLTRLRDRAVLISVDTAWRPLLAAGLAPHLVVGVDPSEQNGANLLGIPEQTGTWVVAEGSVWPEACRGFGGSLFTFRVADHHPWPWLHAHRCRAGLLDAWGSVLTTAFDLASRLGCNPIVFAGADLAYSLGLLYCRNTVYEPAWAHLTTVAARAEALYEQVHRSPTCMQPDVSGEPVLTAPRFLQFRDRIVSRAAGLTGRTVLNVTGGGVLYGPGITQVPPSELVLPAAGERDCISGAKFRALYETGRASRKPSRNELLQALSRDRGEGAPAPVWLEAAAGTITAGQIAEALAQVRVALEAQDGS